MTSPRGASFGNLPSLKTLQGASVNNSLWISRAKYEDHGCANLNNFEGGFLFFDSLSTAASSETRLALKAHNSFVHIGSNMINDICFPRHGKCNLKSSPSKLVTTLIVPVILGGTNMGKIPKYKYIYILKPWNPETNLNLPKCCPSLKRKVGKSHPPPILQGYIPRLPPWCFGPALLC